MRRRSPYLYYPGWFAVLPIMKLQTYQRFLRDEAKEKEKAKAEAKAKAAKAAAAAAAAAAATVSV